MSKKQRGYIWPIIIFLTGSVLEFLPYSHSIDINKYMKCENQLTVKLFIFLFILALVIGAINFKHDLFLHLTNVICDYCLIAKIYGDLKLPTICFL